MKIEIKNNKKILLKQTLTLVVILTIILYLLIFLESMFLKVELSVIYFFVKMVSIFFLIMEVPLLSIFILAYLSFMIPEKIILKPNELIVAYRKKTFNFKIKNIKELKCKAGYFKMSYSFYIKALSSDSKSQEHSFIVDYDSGTRINRWWEEKEAP